MFLNTLETGAVVYYFYVLIFIRLQIEIKHDGIIFKITLLLFVQPMHQIAYNVSLFRIFFIFINS